MENIVYLNDLKQINLEISERSTTKPVIKKLAELSGGQQAILEHYTGIYNDEMLSEMLDDYNQQKMSEISAELSSYDEYSQLLVDKANMYINKLESSMQNLADPTTEYELQQRNYLVDKLKNTLITAFTSAAPSMDEIDSVFKQAEYNKGYARALTHLQSILTRNIDSNNQISDGLKQSLHVDLADKMQEVHKQVLPVDYQTVQEIKKNIDNNIGLAIGQLHQFDVLNNIE